jgi:hypothetical protein
MKGLALLLGLQQFASLAAVRQPCTAGESRWQAAAAAPVRGGKRFVRKSKLFRMDLRNCKARWFATLVAGTGGL